MPTHSHTYVGNPGYVFRLASVGVVTLNPGDPVSLTDDEAAAYGEDFALATKTKTTKTTTED